MQAAREFDDELDAGGQGSGSHRSIQAVAAALCGHAVAAAASARQQAVGTAPIVSIPPMQLPERVDRRGQRHRTLLIGFRA
jgi:hypothetical protein